MAFKKASLIVGRMDAGYECIRVYSRVVIGSETMFYLAIAEIKPLSMIWKTPQEKVQKKSENTTLCWKDMKII